MQRVFEQPRDQNHRVVLCGIAEPLEGCSDLGWEVLDIGVERLVLGPRRTTGRNLSMSLVCVGRVALGRWRESAECVVYLEAAVWALGGSEHDRGASVRRAGLDNRSCDSVALELAYPVDEFEQPVGLEIRELLVPNRADCASERGPAKAQQRPARAAEQAAAEPVNPARATTWIPAQHRRVIAHSLQTTCD